MSNHTKEPWNGKSLKVCFVEFEKLGVTVAIPQHSDEEAKANARRIVACVNACAGIETDRLEQIPKLKQDPLPIWTAYCEKKMQLEDVTEQRDELLAALNEIESLDWKRSLKSLDRPTDFAERQAALSSFCDAQAIASKAIAKAKGGAA